MENDSSQSQFSQARTTPKPDPATWAHSFEEYWPLYLSQHNNPRTRWWHYVGTLAGIGAGLFVFGRSSVSSSLVESLLLAVFAEVVVSYGVLFASHWIVEGNQPATLQAFGKSKGQIAKELWWAIRGDFKMLGLALKEALPQELERQNLK
jgi:hypothetical protein